MDFIDYEKMIESEKTILVQLEPAIDLSIMTLSTGSSSYYLPVEKLGSRESGYYFYPQFSCVYQDGSELTEQTGITSVDQNAGSWYFDDTSENIYIRAASDATPGKVSLLAVFPLYFSNKPVITADKFYAPRLADVPITITSSIDDIYFSLATIGGGSISFDNTEGFFDKLSCRYIWKNRDIAIQLGDKSMTAASYATVFTGKLRDMKINEQNFTFTIQDNREYLHKNLPVHEFKKSDYPDMDDDIEGLPIPIAYGYIESAAAYLIDSTVQKGKFKFADHPVTKVYDIYNNAVKITRGLYSVDLDNGEFTILNTWGGTADTITVEFIGVPGTCNFEDKNFSDNDISDWEEVRTGGIAVYSASDGKVNISMSASDDYAYLVKTNKEFAVGDIEVKAAMQSGPNSNSAFGIVCDWVDENNNIMLVCFPNKGKIKIFERISGVNYQRDENITVTINIGTQYTIKAGISSSGELKGYLDGVEVVSYAFGETFTPRPVGIWHYYEGNTDFDDFKIVMSYLVTGAPIVQDIYTRFLGVDSSNVDTTSFENAEYNASQNLRVYIGTSISSKVVLGKIAASNLCRILIGADGKVFYEYWAENEIVDKVISESMLLDHFESFDQTDDIFSKVIINYEDTSGETDGLSDSYSENYVEHSYGRPYSKSFNTYLIHQSDAEKLAYKYFHLAKSPTLRTEIQTKILGMDLKVGDIIQVQRKRGFSTSGRLSGTFRIIGIKKDIDIAVNTLTLINENDALGLNLCDEYCQSSCESACQASCQQLCQESCEITCQGSCQLHCQTDAMKGTSGDCEESTEDSGEEDDPCEESCQLSCESVCMISNQLGCQETCEKICQIMGEIEP